VSAFEALVLGIVQGVTEFLPISSTAHLRIVPHWLGWSDPGTEFSAVIQLGTLLSVLLYFREDVVRLTCAALRSLADRKLFATQDSRLAWSIVVGTLPVVILGLGFKDWIKTEARQLWIIGVALIGLAILLWLAERYSRRRGNLDTLGFWSVQGIGLCQALALIPGCSRSGSTIMGGLLVGLDCAEAARFSFLLGLPAILGSGLFELWELSHSGFGNHGTLPLLLGIGSAFVCGWVAIEFLLRFLRTHGTLVFVLYRLLLGSVILATLP